LSASIATVVILAAGLGTRMRSATPKVLHTVCGLPLLSHVLRATAGLDRDSDSAPRTVVVLGHGQGRVEDILPEGCLVAVQEKQLGTGHAVLAAAEQILGGIDGPMLVLPGDTPLITTEALRALVDTHRSSHAEATVLTMRLTDPTGYGRVLREPDGGDVARIVEDRDATEEERRTDEVNSGMYVLPGRRALEILAGLGAENAQGEIYLTDVVEELRRRGGRVGAVVTPDPRVCLGVNSRVELSEAQVIMNRRICREWMLAGVTIDDPASTLIEVTVTLEPDTRVLPFTCLRGRTSIARGSEVGPCATLIDTVLGRDCRVRHSCVEGATLEPGAEVGPFPSVVIT
jgi:bifunctional UDP-N-acetylglucosamine pyrophosphorylase / glucosamine-1-phosphate N-acetyltransferase